MAYSIKVEWIGRHWTPGGKLTLHEAETEMEAIAVAAYDAEASRADTRRVAPVFDAVGRLVLAYAGRPKSLKP